MIKDPQERRALTAIVLCMVVFWVWSAFFGPKPTEAQAAVGTPTTAIAATGNDGAPAVPTAAATPSPADAVCTGAEVVVGTGVGRLTASDCGGLRSIAFPDVPAAVEVTPWWTWAFRRVTGATASGWQAYGDERGQQELLTEKGEFLAVGRGDRVSTGVWTTVSTAPLVQSRSTADGLMVTRTITPDTTDAADTNRWDVSLQFTATQPVPGPFWVGVSDHFGEHRGRYSSIPQLEAVVDGDLEAMADPTDVESTTVLEGPVTWFGVGDKYFLAALAPAEPTGGKVEWRRLDADRIGAYYVLSNESIGPGAPLDVKFKLYAGMRELDQLARGNVDFSSAVSLGWFGFFAKILLFTLRMFNDVLHNWGWSILALTLLTRLAVYPLTRSAVQSGRKMQALQPQLKLLQEKYADDKETLNREMMALWSRNGVNPLGGCFPILIQMPVFFALFAALSYEPNLFHADFWFLKDLSAQDPYGITGVLIVAGMYVQQLMTPMTGMDPSQQQMMKLMPLVFGFMMFSVPSGLALYYVLNTVLAIVQQWYNTRSIPLNPPGEANVPS